MILVKKLFKNCEHGISRYSDSSMSITDNIRLGKNKVPIEEVIKAAKATCIHERITQLPKVLKSGEVVLSGGEPQRIAIARTFLKDAPILILDEATASLDLENEPAVQQAFANLCRGKITLVIAHRLWTIQDADIIFVMDKGRIIEQGSHIKLINYNELYAKL